MSLMEEVGSQGVQIDQLMQKKGVILAEITNIKDPENLDRVKCKPISSDADVAETDWCHVIMPAAGNGSGIFFFPNVGDLVILTFLGGNVHHPIVLGRYWADKVKSPYPVKDGVNEISGIKTPGGVEMKFNDKKDEYCFSVTMPSGTELSINDKDKKVEIKDKNGENAFAIGWEKGEVELKAKSKLTLKVGESSIVMEQSGEVKITAQKAVNIAGIDIALKGNASVAVGAPKVDVKADGTLTAEASGVTTIKGGIVKIN